MDRRGIYRKGSAGHVRNINSYLLAREKFKKWRLPFTVVISLVFVFGAAPIVGDNFSTSVFKSGSVKLELPDGVSIEQLRKTLLDQLNSFTAQCKQFGVAQCREEGEQLGKAIVSNDADVQLQAQHAVAFMARFEPQLAQAACAHDLGETLAAARNLENDLENFTKRYGQALAIAVKTDTDLNEIAEALRNSIDNLNSIVEHCRSR